MNDPIADMLTRIRNAQMVNKIEAEIPYSKFKEALANKLAQEGYLNGVMVNEANETNPYKTLTIKLKYYQSQAVIENIKRISKPSLRQYVSKDSLPKVKNGLGVALISTSKGLMTDAEARNKGLGGEIVCEVY